MILYIKNLLYNITNIKTPVFKSKIARRCEMMGLKIRRFVSDPGIGFCNGSFTDAIFLKNDDPFKSHRLYSAIISLSFSLYSAISRSFAKTI